MKTNLLTLFLLISFSAFCQNGPGGVGTRNGASSLVLWLDANSIAGSNGATITNWSDLSGYGYNFNAGNGAVLTKPAQNGKAALTFNGTSNYFERGYTANLSPSSYTIFTVSNVTSSAIHKAIISNRNDPPQSGYILYALPTTNDWSFWTGNGAGWDFVGNANSTHGVWASQALTFTSGSGDKTLYINEGTTFNSSDPTAIPNTTRPIRIGAGANESSPDFFFLGSIGEVIIYNTVLNAAQRIIVQNYLASKYNFTLTANDLYVNDNAGNGNYDTDMGGIGRIDASNIHNDAQGGIVRVLNPTNLDDGEFMFWAHDNGQAEAKNTTDVPAGVQARFNRIWRVNEVNTSGAAISVGNVDMRFDLSNFTSITTSDLRLLVDVNNNGIFSDDTPISGAVSLGGGIYAFNGVSTLANGRRFTIATINTLQTPLPISLTDFKVAPVNKSKVAVSWTTSSEINNSYFTILRSKDNTSWDEVTRVTGAGNSSITKNYSTVDDNPFPGISFYRLKQTDLNGKETYSDIKSVNLGKSDNFNVSVYPNPASRELIIKGDEEELKEISVYTLVGQNITASLPVIRVNSAYYKINISGLKQGMYILKTKNSAQTITKQ